MTTRRTIAICLLVSVALGSSAAAAQENEPDPRPGAANEITYWTDDQIVAWNRSSGETFSDRMAYAALGFPEEGRRFERRRKRLDALGVFGFALAGVGGVSAAMSMGRVLPEPPTYLEIALGGGRTRPAEPSAADLVWVSSSFVSLLVGSALGLYGFHATAHPVSRGELEGR